MRHNSVFRGWRRRRLPLFAVVAAIVGCQATQSVDPAAMRSGQDEFREKLSMTTQAINLGDLPTARERLSEARTSAVTARDLQKIESLDQLIVGAEALRSGDAAGAKAAWSRIEEPRLAREVRHKARMIGVEVPMVPVEEGATR